MVSTKNVSGNLTVSEIISLLDNLGISHNLSAPTRPSSPGVPNAPASAESSATASVPSANVPVTLSDVERRLRRAAVVTAELRRASALRSAAAEWEVIPQLLHEVPAGPFGGRRTAFSQAAQGVAATRAAEVAAAAEALRAAEIAAATEAAEIAAAAEAAEVAEAVEAGNTADAAAPVDASGRSSAASTQPSSSNGVVCFNCGVFNSIRAQGEAFYVVTVGTRVGVLRSWINTQPHVIGIRGASFVRYSDEESANEVFEEALRAGNVRIVNRHGDVIRVVQPGDDY